MSSGVPWCYDVQHHGKQIHAGEWVWAVITDVERWPEWTPSVTNIQRLDDGPLALGSRAWVRQPKLRPAVWTVTAMDDRSFAWTTRGRGVSVIARHSVDAVEDSSRVTLSVEFCGWFGTLIVWMTRGLSNRYLELEAAGLKHRNEDWPIANG